MTARLCLRCKYELTWARNLHVLRADDNIQYGMPPEEAKARQPSCRKCMTVIMRNFGVGSGAAYAAAAASASAVD